MKTKYTDGEFAEAVKKAKTLTEVARILGISTKPSRIKQRIDRLNIDDSHLCKWNRGIPSKKYKRTLKDLLVQGEYRDSDNLKQRLLREEIFEKECSICKLKNWIGKAITLQLDHIDGDRYNNLQTNLRLLCPNCHSQTDTYCGRNIKNIRYNSLIHSKLTELQVLNIFKRVHNGEKLQSLANEFEVSIQQISNIKHKKQWNHLLKDL